MVGLSLACLLREAPLRLVIVDRQTFDPASIPYASPASAAEGGQFRPSYDPRVSAITASSKTLFQSMAVWDEVERHRCQPYTQMEVWDAEGTGRVRFSASELRVNELGTIVENSILLKALYSAAANQENLSLATDSGVESLHPHHRDGRQHHRLRLENGGQIDCRLLVAADGANSRIRSLANFPTSEWDYGHTAIVTTIATAKPHQCTAYQRFIDTGPLALLPLPSAEDSSHSYSSIVWSATPERAEALMAMSEPEFAEELGRCCEHKLGDISWIDRRFSFPLRQRHAKHYVQEGIALVGDAAHTIHPLAGQGVNMGLLDSEVLATQILASIERGGDFANLASLKRYQRQRVGHNKGMMLLMEGFKRLFGSEQLPLRLLRNLGMNGVDKHSIIKNSLARQAMGIE